MDTTYTEFKDRQQSFRATLPMPPSLNNYYKHTTRGARGHSRMYKTQEAVSWEEEVQWMLKKNKIEFDKDLMLGMELKLIFKSRGADISNRTKIIQDVLEKAGVYYNDNRLYENHEYKFIDKENPRIELHVWAIDILPK